MIEVRSKACDGCGGWCHFTMSAEQFSQWKSGVFVQYIFPTWSDEDRERLISGTCPDCWEEMFPEEEEDEEDYISGELYDSFLEEADDCTYDRDWYVD